EIAISKKYDYVICGHIHQPQKRIVTNKNGSVTYLNSGDWIEHLTALEYAKNEWTIYQYDSAKFAHVPQQETRQQVSVITDEISFYINSLAI
ncbi:MAG TPA: UDP-2,3-diacylglucosamine diphosphatase, partial [Chitinophagaceae bacterium]|nr:UDP-2,3-diacylglucosamine diphosphatase [Chitinophagaceae bacterium]